MFGDREKYLDKFKTCVRARPFPDQKLPPEFYIKEHTKPLFNKKKILNLRKLFFYHSVNEVFKIFKFRSPIAVLNLFKFSTLDQKDLFLITPTPSNTFVYKGGVNWNVIKRELKIDDASTPVSSLKSSLKKFLLEKQSLGNEEDWIGSNFFQGQENRI